MSTQIKAEFNANYNVIFDGENYKPLVDIDAYINIEIVKYSKNGTHVIAYGGHWQNSTPFAFLGYKAYLIDVNGLSNTYEIPLPQRDDGFVGALKVKDIAINDDGSIIYISTAGTNASQTGGTYNIPAKLYRLDIEMQPINITVTQIADFNFLHPVNTQTPFLQTTSVGDWVYYVNTNNLPDGGHYDIYRLSSAGDVFQTVVQDSALELTVTSTGCQGRGDYISPEGFSISGDGSKVLFRIRTILNNTKVCMNDQDWWVLKTSTEDTVLNPDNIRGSSGGMVSPDGSKIVIADDNNYYSYLGDGSNQQLIEPQSYNYAGPSMTSNGSKYFYRDNIHEYGMVLNTNGISGLPVLPKYRSINNPLINDEGNLIVFSSGRRIYAGKLYVTDNSNSSAPIVNLTFDPPYIIEDNTNPVALYISTQALVGGIADVQIDHITEGEYADSNTVYSHYFFDPVDTGFHGDLIAGDGIYTDISNPRNGGNINSPVAVKIRVSVTDTLGNIKVIEKQLQIGIYANGFE